MRAWQAAAQPQEVANILQHLVLHHLEEHLQHPQHQKWSSILPASHPLLSALHGTISLVLTSTNLFSSRSAAAKPKHELVPRAR